MWGTCGLDLSPYPTPSQTRGSAQDSGLDDDFNMLIWWGGGQAATVRNGCFGNLRGRVPHLLQAAARLIGQGVHLRSAGREQGEAGADVTPGAAAGVGQPEGAAFVEV